MRPLAFVDLETTGANAMADRITEIGMVLVDDSGLETWSSLVNPGCRIPAFIENLTGIHNDMVAAAPCFDALAPEVFRRLEGRLFVAHNVRFDYGFLKQSFKRAGCEFRASMLCTVRLSRTLYPAYRRHNLDSLIERHGLQADQRHRALADAQLIHQFWQIARGQHPPARFDAAVQGLTARPSLPAHLPETLLDDLPESPGVYLFHGDDDCVLYVGKSRNLRQRVLAHFSGDLSSSKEAKLSQQVRRVQWIATGGEIGALLREAALIKALQPVYNRQLRHRADLQTITLHETPGRLQVEVVPASDLDAVPGRKMYGLYSTVRAARTALVHLADEHGLCRSVMGLEDLHEDRPCFARQLGRCRGACIGAEHLMQHSIRLLQALASLQLRRWPFDGAAGLREGRDLHLIDRWAYLGTARSAAELEALLEAPQPRFDRDGYRILQRHAARLQPLQRTQLQWDQT